MIYAILDDKASELGINSKTYQSAVKEIAMLSLPQVRDVCLGYTGGADMCRYLSYDDVTGGNICLKKVSAKKDIIDAQVKKFVDKAKSQGQDPRQMGRALGDNCKGYAPLKTLKQGYDVDGGP